MKTKETQYDLAVFVGRCEPPHDGHKWLMEFGLSVAHQLLVILGSDGVNNEDNPIPGERRRGLVNTMITYEHWNDRVVEIALLPDGTDREWVTNVDEIVQKYVKNRDKVVFVGNNPWVNNLVAQQGYVVQPVKMQHRRRWQGRIIRKQIWSLDNDWKESVPDYLHQLIIAEM